MSGYYVPGTKGNDYLISKAPIQILVGLAGDDTLVAGSENSSTAIMTNLLGGSGNDTYILEEKKGMVLVADLAGNDVLQIPYTKSQVQGLADKGHATVDGSHYAILFSEDFGVLVLNHSGRGRIETIRYSDGQTDSIDNFGKLFGDKAGLSSKDLDISSEFSLMLQMDNMAAQAEAANANVYLPPWFDADAYMARHRAKMAPGYSAEEHADAFILSGFIGQEGIYRHFQSSGQWEDVSPTSLFDVNYYYTAKAASVYNTSISKVTSAQVNYVSKGIHDLGMNAWMHYTLYGTREGIDPSSKFDTSKYMETKAAMSGVTVDALSEAFAAMGYNALSHYEECGKNEGITLTGVNATMAAVTGAEDIA